MNLTFSERLDVIKKRMGSPRKFERNTLIEDSKFLENQIRELVNLYNDFNVMYDLSPRTMIYDISREDRDNGNGNS